MDEFFVTSVDSGGTATTTRHQTLDAAEKALEDEKPRAVRKEILGVGLDHQDPSGSIHPLKAFMTHNASDEDVFLNAIKELRRRGYPPS